MKINKCNQTINDLKGYDPCSDDTEINDWLKNKVPYIYFTNQHVILDTFDRDFELIFGGIMTNMLNTEKTSIVGLSMQKNVLKKMNYINGLFGGIESLDAISYSM